MFTQLCKQHFDNIIYLQHIISTTYFHVKGL